MIYFDTSAFVKLVWQEAESGALWAYVTQRRDDIHVSSALLAIEVRRAALRSGLSLPRADLALERIGLIDIGPAVVEHAGRLPDPALRSRDAIHLATALMVASELEAFVTYDKRLAAAASATGLVAIEPR